MNKSFFQIFRALSLESFRNKLELFFSAFFPILLLILFGFVFGSMSESTEKRRIAVVVDENCQELLTALEKTDLWNLLLYESTEDMMDSIKNGNSAFGIHISSDKLQVFYTSSDPALEPELKMMLPVIETRTESAINNIKSALEVVEKEVQVSEVKTTELDYIITGVISISLLTSGMFSMINIFGRYKKRGVLKRIIASPAKPITFVSGVILARFLINILAAVILLLISKLMFKPHYVINWYLFIPSFIFISLGMMGLGILLLVIFKRYESAQNAASILNIIMIFFAGVYFPLSWMPNYLRWVAYVLPVKYAADLIRCSTGVESMHMSVFWALNGIFCIVGVLTLWMAANLFMKSD